MKKIILIFCAALIVSSSACSIGPQGTSINPNIPTASVSPHIPLISPAPDTEPPTSQSPQITTLSVFTKSMLTNGDVTVVPNMKFLEIPLKFRNTLLLVDGNKKLPESDPEYGIVNCRVYENDELTIMTVSYNEELVDKTDTRYSDAGIEYVYEINVKNKSFFNYQEVKIGDSTSACGLEGTGSFKTSGTPYMLITYQDDVVVGLTAGSFTEIEMLKNAVISTESLMLPTPAPLIDTSAPTQSPDWAKVSEEHATSFKDLNLDGVGEADDAVYASVYRWGEKGDAATVIIVKLGTGEVLSKVYEGFTIPVIHFGHLLSATYDALVVELWNPYSNYGATSLHVLEIVPVGADAFPSIIEKLSLAGGDDASIEETKLVPTEVVMGSEIVSLPDSTLQGIKVKMLNNQERFLSLYGILKFEDEKWVMAPEV